MKELIPAMNNLKIRASYGKSGMDTGNAWEYVRAYSSSANNGYTFDGTTLTPGMTAPGVVNDNLTWVTSIITNLGVDFELWRGLLGGTFELFQRKNEGTLGNSLAVIPNTFGASFPQENLFSNKNLVSSSPVSHQADFATSTTPSPNFTLCTV